MKQALRNLRKNNHITQHKERPDLQAFYEQAVQYLQSHFTQNPISVVRRTVSNDTFKCSAYEIHQEGETPSTIIITPTNKLKKEDIIKATVFEHLNNEQPQAQKQIYVLHLNAKYRTNNNEALFRLENITEACEKESQSIIQEMNVKVLAQPEPPKDSPYNVLPKPWNKEIKAILEKNPQTTFDELPLCKIPQKQRQIFDCHLQQMTFFNQASLKTELKSLINNQDIYFLDFEATQMITPTLANLAPWEQLPFQYSLHKLSQKKLSHFEYINLEKDTDPRRALAEQLIRDCQTTGVIFSYSAQFERTVIKKLAHLYPEHYSSLMAICLRIADMLPLFKKHYYNPLQEGSYSLKKLLPAVLGFNPYDALEGTSNGSDASRDYMLTMFNKLSANNIKQGLLDYCELDTKALYILLVFALN